MRNEPGDRCSPQRLLDLCLARYPLRLDGSVLEITQTKLAKYPNSAGNSAAIRSPRAAIMGTHAYHVEADISRNFKSSFTLGDADMLQNYAQPVTIDR